MLGAVFLGNRKVEIRKFPDPTPGPGEVVIEMKASGMCGSDLKFYRSAPGEAQKSLGFSADAEPFIGGHEPCGVVAARGPGVSEREAPIGQRVMDHHYSGCGVCKHCRVGWSQLCKAGITVYGVTAHGGHAQYLKVPARTLVPLPEELSFVAGAAVSCGTGTAYGALRRMHLAGGSTLAVFGQGPVGISATVLGAKMGARVIAVEKNAERRALAKKFGAALALESEKEIKRDHERRGRGPRARHARASRPRGSPPCARRRPGAPLLRRRGRRRYPRRQPRHAAQAADDHRLVDLQRDGTAGVRPLRRRQRHRRRRAVFDSADTSRS